VIALTPEGKVILVKQYRAASAELSYDFPGGGIDANETDPVAAAQRELSEETGYESHQWHNLGKIFAASHRMINPEHLLLALDCQCVTQHHRDSTEFIDIVEVTPAELDRMILVGEFTSAICISHWYKAKLSGLMQVSDRL